MLLKLKKNFRARVLHGHPWVFADEIESPLPDSFNGLSVGLLNHKDDFLGSGIYNNHSQIIWRRFSHQNTPFDESHLSQAIQTAISKRGTEKFCRLIWSESDFIPGLVVDKFDSILVIQALTLAVDIQLPTITNILLNTLHPQEIIYRNDAPVRTLEGLTRTVDTHTKTPFAPRFFKIDDISYWIDLQTGQKTGFYLDQRIQSKKLSSYTSGKTVLDGFCNQGSFALNAKKTGATHVTAVDISQACIDLASKNSQENNLPISFHCADMFDFLSANQTQKFDVIILDPPPFAKTKQKAMNALRGYKELNLKALKMLNKHGILATYSCSQHITLDLFHDMLTKAAIDAKQDTQLIEIVIQPTDHPIMLNMPESWYLKGLIIQTL